MGTAARRTQRTGDSRWGARTLGLCLIAVLLPKVSSGQDGNTPGRLLSLRPPEAPAGSWFSLAGRPKATALDAMWTQPEASPPAGAESGQEAEASKTEGKEEGSLFLDPKDGYFDVSKFLSSKTGFLPLAMPITEPAVGYGLTLGLTYFHSEPTTVPGRGGEPSRIIMPSTTVLMGAGTENGTWATGLAHLGMWDEGRIRYLGAAGYAALDLDWFGRSDALNGRSISYENDMFFFFQQIRFQLGDSDFFLGPQYRFFSSDATFDAGAKQSGIPQAELDSQTSGLGVDFSYDSLDQPFSPTRGWRAGMTLSEQATWLGGDFDYLKAQTYAITYIPLADRFVLGLRLNVDGAGDEAPFYDLPGLFLRGVQRGRYVDDRAVYGEGELRWDFTDRWTAVGFAGAGRVASEFDEMLDADTHYSGGGGIRYLIASAYGLRMGVDLAYSEDDWTVYVTIGTGWVRP